MKYLEFIKKIMEEGMTITEEEAEYIKEILEKGLAKRKVFTDHNVIIVEE